MSTQFNQNDDYVVRIHLVKHQEFYTPVYLCNGKFKLEFVYEPYETSDKKLVEELFQPIRSKENVIDVFMTGGSDVVQYLHEHPKTEKSTVCFWSSIVDRFPLPLVMQTQSHEKYGNLNIGDVGKHAPEKILCPPEGTTLHYYMCKFHDAEMYIQQHIGSSLTEQEKQKIIASHRDHTSPFAGKLAPQKDFKSIITEAGKDPSSWAFTLPHGSNMQLVEKIHPPMEVVLFTALYTRDDIWQDEKKREFLQLFCKHISMNITEIHEFKQYYEKQPVTGIYDTGWLNLVFDILFPGHTDETFLVEKQDYIANLKYLARNRIFATNLSEDLQIRITKEEEPDSELCITNRQRIFYWMREGYIKNAELANEEFNKKKNAYIAFKSGVINSTYNIGHLIKNRLTDSMKALSNFYRSIDSITYDKKRLKEVLYTAIMALKRAEKIGLFLNLISLIEDEQNDSVFSTLPISSKVNNFLNNQIPYDLRRGFDSILNYMEKNYEISSFGFDTLNALEIRCISEKKTGVFRPKSFFYDEIILELLYNACNHAEYAEEKPKHRIIHVHYEWEHKGISITNEITAEKYNALSIYQQQPGENRWADLFHSTGVYNYAQFLRLTKTGDIMWKMHKEDDRYYFNVLLILKGLTNKNNEQDQNSYY